MYMSSDNFYIYCTCVNGKNCKWKKDVCHCNICLAQNTEYILYIEKDTKGINGDRFVNI